MASAPQRMSTDGSSRAGGRPLAAGRAVRTLASRFFRTLAGDRRPGQVERVQPAAAGLVAGLLIGALAAPAVLAADAARYVKPGSRAAALPACVEPTAYMRRHHMDLIQHQRDATVHGGIRGTRHSLAGCIDCHVSTGPDGRAMAVNAQHQFCSACHQFAAVKVNCFDCHAGVPKGGALSAAALAAARIAAGAAAATDPAVAGGTGP